MVDIMDHVVLHECPVWGSKANFIIKADLTSHGMEGRWEQLWARRIDANRFEVCCIPFFTYGIGLGDQVIVSESNIIEKVSTKGGHSTLRVAVADKENIISIHDILHQWLDNITMPYE